MSSSPAGGHRGTQSPAGGHRGTQSPAGGHRGTQSPAGGHRGTQSPAGGQRSTQSPKQTTAPNFMSMGPLVLDHVQFANGTTRSNVPGGTGLYATVGARIVTPKTHASTIGCLIVAGNDFPEAVLKQVRDWGLTLQVRVENKPSTRGFMEYKDDQFDEKVFRFTTEPLFTRISHLEGSTLLHSSSFHFLDLPNALVQKIEELKGARRAAGLSKAPRLIWEPKPSACEVSHLQEHLQACKLVDVFSPNHVELVSLVEGIKTAPFSRNVVERCAKRLVDSGVGSDNDGIVLVRCGEHGSMICRRSHPPKWFPPYHTSSGQVVDATGAGNSFLGGFIAGMNLSSGDPIEAVIHGTVAASLVIEQFGLPILDQGPNYERWNGKIVASRLQEYRARVALV